MHVISDTTTVVIAVTGTFQVVVIVLLVSLLVLVCYDAPGNHSSSRRRLDRQCEELFALAANCCPCKQRHVGLSCIDQDTLRNTPAQTAVSQNHTFKPMPSTI